MFRRSGRSRCTSCAYCAGGVGIPDRFEIAIAVVAAATVVAVAAKKNR